MNLDNELQNFLGDSGFASNFHRECLASIFIFI